MTLGPDCGSAVGIVANLRTTSRSIEGTIRKYSGVFVLRTRQLSCAAAIGDARQRRKALKETSTGYAADLTQYGSELRPDVLAFVMSCSALETCYAAARAHGSPPPAASRAVRDHTEQLKMARGSRDLVREAKRAADNSQAIGAVAAAAVRQVKATLDEYLSAIETLEALSLKALRGLGADARRWEEGTHG